VEGGCPEHRGTRGRLSTRVAVGGGAVTAGSGRPPRLSPASPLFMSPCVGTGALTPGPPQPRPAGHSPWMTPPWGGRPAQQPPRRGGGGCHTGHPPPPVGPPGTVSGPAPDTRAHPWPPPPFPPYGDGAYPVAPAGRPPRSGADIADEDRGSTRAPHWGARRPAVLARPPHTCGPGPLALGHRDGDPFGRENCDDPSHGPPHSGNQIPRKYAPLTHVSNCSVGDPLVIISWLTNHNRNPNTSLGFVTPPRGPRLKGLILCKPNLDYRLMLLCAPDPGAPRGCHVAPFARLYSRRYSKLRPSSGVWAQWALRGVFSMGPLRVSEEGFPRVL